MAAFQGYNPYGGYGVPNQMSQPMYSQPMQQYMSPQPTQMQQQMPQINVAVRLVTNYNEADAAQIAFDNTINLFVNLAANEIYVKRFNPNTGMAPIAVYRQEQPQNAQEASKPQQEYATIDMFASLENRVNELAEAMTPKRATRGVKSDE